MISGRRARQDANFLRQISNRKLRAPRSSRLRLAQNKIYQHHTSFAKVFTKLVAVTKNCTCPNTGRDSCRAIEL